MRQDGLLVGVLAEPLAGRVVAERALHGRHVATAGQPSPLRPHTGSGAGDGAPAGRATRGRCPVVVVSVYIQPGRRVSVTAGPCRSGEPDQVPVVTQVAAPHVDGGGAERPGDPEGELLRPGRAGRLGDGRPVMAVLVGDDAAAGRQEPGAIPGVTPAGPGELGGVRGDPGERRDLVVAETTASRRRPDRGSGRAGRAGWR